MDGLYNRMLDRCAELRDGLGPISDNIGLGTALEALWLDEAASAAEKPGPSSGKAASECARALRALGAC